MPFQKGNTLGGRKKGTPNKINSDIRQFVIDVAGKLQKDPTKSIESIDAADFWTKIFPKIIPRDINVKAQLWTRQLSDEELDERIRQIQAELNESTTETDAESEPE